jgi:hypothetical protein
MWWVANTMLRPLYSRERPGTHCIEGWVSPRASLDACGKPRPPTVFDPRTVQPVASRYTGPRRRLCRPELTCVLSEVQTVLVSDFTGSISCRILIRYLVWQEYGSLFGTRKCKSGFMRNEDGWLSSLPSVRPPLLLDGAKMAVFHGMCETFCVSQQPVTFCFRYPLSTMMRYCTSSTDRIL